MKTADITVGENYAVATYNESHQLGDSRLVKAIVTGVGVTRTYIPGGSWYRTHSNDGIEVTHEGPEWESSDKIVTKTKVVRAQAIKGLWSDHVEVRDRRKAAREEFEEKRRRNNQDVIRAIEAINDLAGTNITTIDETRSPVRPVKVSKNDLLEIARHLQAEYDRETVGL